MMFVGDPLITCSDNMRIALENGRPDIARIWEICENLARVAYSSSNHFRRGFSTGLVHQDYPHYKHSFPHKIPWERHPNGRKALSQVILGQVQNGRNDFQTAAMIICAFTPSTKRKKKYR